MADSLSLGTPASRCLDEQVVLDLIAGDLNGAALAGAERHLAGCDGCIELIARVAPALQQPTSPPTQLGQRDGERPRPAEGNQADAAVAASGDDGEAAAEAQKQQPRSESAPSLQPGTILRDTYRIVRHIEKGGMGEVYEASHTRLSGRYAVKVLPPEFAAKKSMLSRFRREAQIASGLQHPNIVQVIDFHETDEGRPYLVMEYLDGENLASLLARHGPFTLAEALPIIQQVAAALGAVHRKGIVHRDIKPPNVFIVPQQDGTRLVKLLDFGISKGNAASSAVTRGPALMGTPQYMAPEQALRRTEDIGPATDQFALAAVVYEMLTGRPAFDGPLVSVVLYHIVHEPPSPMGGDGAFDQIEPILHRALAKKASERFSSMAEFTSALTAAASPSAPLAVAPPYATDGRASIPPVSSTTSNPNRRLPTAAIAALVVAAVVAAAITVLVIRWISPATQLVAGSATSHSVGDVPGARPAPPATIRSAFVDDRVPEQSGGGARASAPAEAAALPRSVANVAVPSPTKLRTHGHPNPRRWPTTQPSRGGVESLGAQRPAAVEPAPVAPPVPGPQSPPASPIPRLVEEL